jgi:tetratricopeptide (TPR) repeat protein
VERGKSYRFDVVTNPKHDVYFSKKDIGWGASAWSEGVQGAYIYEGTIMLDVTDDTPDELYYSCRNHPYMGGKIHVVNPGEKVEIATSTSSATKPGSQQAEATKKPQISAAMVNQKLMFADMLIKSSGAKRVQSSNNEDAKVMQAKAESLVSEARKELKQGDHAAAYSKAEKALANLKQAARLVPDEAEIARQKEQHEELLASLKHFEESHEDNYKRVKKAAGESAAVQYDHARVAAFKEQAHKLAGKGNYVEANNSLEQAQRLITEAIQQMLNSRTIVYDLNFETAEEEYEYELKRFGGYEELIPIAVEQKRPSEGAKKLMRTFLKKGQDMRDKAIKKAEAGDHASAIPMLQSATKEVRRALRMVGVMQ